MKRYLRYVDDFCVFSDDKGYLTLLRQEIAAFLSSNLRLRLNERKSRVRQLKEGIEFLGFVVRPERLCLNQTCVRRQRQRVRLSEKWLTWEVVKASLQAWNARCRARRHLEIAAGYLRRDN